MAKFDIVVIGASAGGVGFLQRVVERLPASFDAAVFVALHLPDGVRSMLPAILDRAGLLPALQAENGAPIKPGHVYVAPPGFHLTLEKNRMRVMRGAREHGLRPAIDPLFRSAASWFGPRTIGVVLSGLLDDGTLGLREIKRAGGVAVVQDPAETPWPSMPESALAHVDVDYTLQASDIGERLATLVASSGAAAIAPAVDKDTLAKELKELTMHEDERDHPGNPSPYSCPGCGGVLWELQDGELLRFRCRVGHGYSSETLTAEQATAVEQALWTALRALEEQAGVRRRVADRMRRVGHLTSAHRFDERVRDLEEQARSIRDLLMPGVGARAADQETR
jgi:two-component system, chemotaxis family, protein-glutamate methylesterase/glutaminase